MSSSGCLIVGFGSAGQRHLEIARRISPGLPMVVLRRQGHAGGVPVVHSLDDAIRQCPRIAVIANPSVEHIPVAQRLAEAGIHFLVEKPLSHRLDGVQELIRTCAERNVTAQVGYCLRFNSSLAAARMAVTSGRLGDVYRLDAVVGMHLADWRPGTDYRASVYGNPLLGGGALNELSHEVDLARWFAGEVESLNARLYRTGRLEIEADDSADLVLRFRGGAIGHIHMDMLQRPAVRRLRVVGSNGAIEWDGMANMAYFFPIDSSEAELVHDGSAESRDGMYELQFVHFLSCVRLGTRPLVDLVDGASTLAVLVAARRSSDMRGLEVPV